MHISILKRPWRVLTVRNAVSAFRYLAARATASHSAAAFANGILAGCYLLCLCQWFVAGFGMSLPVIAAMAVALATGAHLASGRPLGWRAFRNRTLVGFAVAHAGLAIWTILFGQLVVVGYWGIARITIGTLTGFPGAFVVPAMLAFGLLCAPAYWITRLAQATKEFSALYVRDAQTRATATRTSLPEGWYLTGVAGGLCIACTLVAPWLGVQATGWLAALASVVLVAIVVWQVSRADGTAQAVASGPLDETSAPHNQASNPLPSLPAGALRVWMVVMVGLIGMLAAAASSLVYQLTPAAGYLLYVEWGALLAGVAATLNGPASKSLAETGDGDPAAEPLRRASCACALLCVGSIALPAAFPVLIKLMLWLNANVSNVALGMLARCALWAAVFAPIGIAWGMLATSLQRNSRPQATSQGHASTSVPAAEPFAGLAPLAFATGFLLMRIAGLKMWEPAWALFGGAIVSVVLACGLWIIARRLPRDRFVHGLGAVAACALLVIPFVRTNADVALPARLLFTTNVFAAHHSGFESRFLPVLDEGRLEATVAGDHGTYTLWKYRGAQFQIRENGIPKGIVSTNTEICPDSPDEVVKVVLPLTLHERPLRVMILGLDSGVALTTALGFPVPEIACVESDPGLVSLLEKHVWPASHVDPLADSRVHLYAVDPAWAAAAGRSRYDVIIAHGDQPALLQSAAHWTVDYYRRVASRLADDGIFCQGFQHVDFGPEPFNVLAASLKRVFRTVAAVEATPGGFVILATNSPAGLVRKGLTERLQRAHVRRAAATLGWDWCVPLSLAALDDDAVEKLVSQGSGACNTAANGRFPFRLPQEIMRWGPKWRERNAALTGLVGNMLAWPNVDGNDPETLRRLAEMVDRHDLLSGYPDQKWAYRTALREQMKRARQSLVYQVNYSLEPGELHPQDDFRKRYFEALGQAVGKKQPVMEDVRRLASFAEPFDPLVSYFVHHEVAELLARAEPRDYEAELMHRLHLAYYSDSRDRSVRNEVAVLNLICGHPEAVPDPLARYDHINGLLQVLRSRWEVRGFTEPKSARIVLNDIEKSVSAMERALACMESLEKELHLPAEPAAARRDYVERTLIRPLRTYRARVLPIHLKQRAQTDEFIKDAIEPAPAPVSAVEPAAPKQQQPEQAGSEPSDGVHNADFTIPANDEAPGTNGEAPSTNDEGSTKHE